MAELFVEVFPLDAGALPPLMAYRLNLTEGQPDRLGNRVARRLRRAYPGLWAWVEGHLLTDTERSVVELSITLDLIKDEAPQRFAGLDGIEAAPDFQLSATGQAEVAIRHPLREQANAMQAALDGIKTRLPNAYVEREYKLQPWTVGAAPAVSVSIASRLIYEQTVQQYAGMERDLATVNEKLAELHVVDTIGGGRGEIVRVLGTVSDHRERLLELAAHEDARRMVEKAMVGEWVVMVRMGDDEFEYLAGMLRLIVRLAQIQRFDVDPRRAAQTLQMTPADRARHVKVVSDVAKEAGLLANAYNSRTVPDAFFAADFEMNLRFDANRVRPYKAETLRYDFSQCGVYHLRPKFNQEPIRVCVVNTLSLKLADFVEALQRQLQRGYDFSIDVVRERTVRVVSRPNLESAVRVVEKEDPDLILAFFPDNIDADDDETAEADATATYIKSLTLGRGLPTHVIYKSTLDDPDAMPAIIMSILGKSGSSPYVLAEPLEGVDYVVGLDVVRQPAKDAAGQPITQLTAIARIYKADGEFIGYAIRGAALPDETTPPYVLVRDLFPQRQFANQRVLLHHDGAFDAGLLSALEVWGKAIGATFYPVEIVRFGAPRIYALDSGIVQPPWGSAFKLNEREALLVSSVPKDDITPQPLHVRLLNGAISIEEVLRSVLVWTVLAYGAEALPKLPVTTTNADQLGYWLRRGGKFSADAGEVPFWL